MPRRHLSFISIHAFPGTRTQALRHRSVTNYCTGWAVVVEYYRVNVQRALNRRFLLGVWTVNSPQSHIVRVYDAGHGKSGVFHSAEWHDGDWSSDGIRVKGIRLP
ncbi:hypothetical protein TNCV_3233001 [Trichonephila clavipes]|nr:hypothetical protein TNCV_3233001 [Trichonephila clavipes]